jgi:hypothetical protein
MPGEPVNQAVLVRQKIADLARQLATNPDENLRANLLKLLFEEREKEDRLLSGLVPPRYPSP